MCILLYKGIMRFLTVCFFIFISYALSYAQDGKALFLQNCASCHAIDRQLTGPALQGVLDRWPNKKNLYAWIHNNQAFLKTGDPYANALYLKFNKTQMNLFPNLTDNEIGAILKYISEWKPPQQATPGSPTESAGETRDMNIVYGIIALILGILALSLLFVNSSLRKIAKEKQGFLSEPPIPFYRNKTLICVVAIILFLLAGYWLTKSAIGLGRDIGYEPKQPIFFSHKVHAGINQINCQYCHIGVYQGKEATIPSVNICMNCHMAINEYKGQAKIYDGEGNEVDGTQQIQKLYQYAHFTPGKPWDASKAEPIAWVRIHQLPHFVYFNHSQHWAVGKIQCQVCHGNIPEMDEVRQFSELSMGWCINCHRTTQVQFSTNGYYSIFQKYHQAFANGSMDSTKGITVEQIGGTDCSKCHY